MRSILKYLGLPHFKHHLIMLKKCVVYVKCLCPCLPEMVYNLSGGNGFGSLDLPRKIPVPIVSVLYPFFRYTFFFFLFTVCMLIVQLLVLFVLRMWVLV